MKTFTIRCRAVLIDEGELLVVQHPHNPTVAVLPGGHLEFGEDPEECLRREIVEELGIEPSIGRLLYVHTFEAAADLQTTEFFFEVVNAAAYRDLEKFERSHAHEIESCLWVSPSDDVQILPEPFSADFKSNQIDASKTRFIKA